MKRTWDEDWDERKAGKGCPMCAEGRPDETYGNARVFTGRVSDAYLVRGDIGSPATRSSSGAAATSPISPS